MKSMQVANNSETDNDEKEVQYLEFGNMIQKGDIKIGVFSITTPEYEFKLQGYAPLRITRKKMCRFSNLFNEVYSQWGRVIKTIKPKDYKRLLQFIADNATLEDVPEEVTRAGDIWGVVLEFFRTAIEADEPSDLQYGYLIRGQYILVEPEYFIRNIQRRLSPILGKPKEFSSGEIYNVLRDKKVIMGRKTKVARLGDHVFRPWLFPAELLVGIIPDIQNNMLWIEKREDENDTESNTGM